MELNIVRSSFSPRENLINKSNYKSYYRIDFDGTIYERIYLDIPDISKREEVIFFHYIMNYERIFLKEKILYDLISRDNPWDFVVKFPDREFNIEITSIADSEEMFTKLKREEGFLKMSSLSKLPLHQLVKQNKLFPKDEIRTIIENYENSGISKNDIVDNPYYHLDFNLFFSDVRPTFVPLEFLLEQVIGKKARKNHEGKENTVVIVDNRTFTYEMSDVGLAMSKLEVFLEKCIFQEIWLYTGYYSELTGENSEFSFFPMKLPSIQKEVLKAL